MSVWNWEWLSSWHHHHYKHSSRTCLSGHYNLILPLRARQTFLADNLLTQTPYNRWTGIINKLNRGCFMCLMNLTSLTPLGRVSRAMGSPPLVLLLIPGSLGIQYLHAPKLPPNVHHCCPCIACALLIPYLLNREGVVSRGQGHGR